MLRGRHLVNDSEYDACCELITSGESDDACRARNLLEEEGACARECERLSKELAHGKHLLTEDSPGEIGAAIVAWYKALPR